MTRILARVAEYESSSLRFAAASVTSHAHANALTLLYSLSVNTRRFPHSLSLSRSFSRTFAFPKMFVVVRVLH